MWTSFHLFQWSNAKNGQIFFVNYLGDVGRQGSLSEVVEAAGTLGTC